MTEKKIGARALRALAILKAGGYFRRQLETQTYTNYGEKFVMRLRGANGRPVKGFGSKTFYELEHLLMWRECAPSSVWPQEYVLKTEDCVQQPCGTTQ